MSRKQRERAQRKYNAGLSKRLRKASMEEWETILQEAEHHIIKINLEVA